MNNQFHKKLLPKSRFKEFVNSGDWFVSDLNSISDIIEERAGIRSYTLLSVTSGVGLVSQKEKFGREIAGNQYKNYYVIKKHDFAYNKSATKLFPEGYIALLKDNDDAAVPNSIFTCFRVKKDIINPQFLDFLFSNNFHGKWLRKFIEVGARAHGSLNIDNKTLFSLPVVFPTLTEQLKIAACLSSLDELITAESEKLEVLRVHKKGLMQQLFPAEGESVPRLRFREFISEGEWSKKVIGEITKVTTGGTPDSTNESFWNGDIHWMNSGELNQKRIYDVANRITQAGLKNSSTKWIPSGCILIGLAGQGKTRGTTAINYIRLCTNQSIASIHPNKQEFVSEFLYHKLDSMYDHLRRLSTGEGGRGGLNLLIIKSIEISFPSLKEQQKIADCLYSLDELINVQNKKVEALKNHKKGLMQQLFPRFEIESA
jgi:type I restriction enzyme, S subunit